MTLLSIQLPPLPLLGAPGHITCSSPPSTLRGFRVLVRGPAVFLVSPPGWLPGLNRTVMDPKGKCRTWEVPRVNCAMVWEGEDVAKLQTYDGEAMEAKVG